MHAVLFYFHDSRRINIMRSTLQRQRSKTTCGLVKTLPPGFTGSLPAALRHGVTLSRIWWFGTKNESKIQPFTGHGWNLLCAVYTNVVCHSTCGNLALNMGRNNTAFASIWHQYFRADPNYSERLVVIKGILVRSTGRIDFLVFFSSGLKNNT